MRQAGGVALCLLLLAAMVAPAAAATIYDFPFDKTPGAGGPGWAMGGGQWQYGTPQGLGGDPAAAHTGSHVYGYDLNSDGLYEDNISPSWTLTTPALNCTGFQNAQLRFWRWLGVESNVYDHARILVSNNGTAWTTIWENGASTIADVAWTQVTYDISAVADGQETVYVRWTMGPSDFMVTYFGWNIDDVEILGDPATEVLAWVPYTDLAWEYPNTIAALDSHYTTYNLTTSTATDASTLEAELVGKHVFLVMEQETATQTQLEDLGAEMAGVLWGFATAGGTVVVLAESSGAVDGFLRSTGLMSADVVDYGFGVHLNVLDGAHPLMAGIGATFTGPDATMTYTVGPEATVLVEEDTSGDAVVAVRQVGAGAVVLAAFDFWVYNTDVARVLANAVQYPRAWQEILLYDNGDPVLHVGKEALNRLNLPFTLCNDDTLDTNLGAQSWHAVAIDCPNWKPTFGWDDFIGYIDGGGHALLSTWSLSAETALCAAFDATAVEDLTAPAAIYDWAAGPPLFDFRESVPTALSGWADLYFGWNRTRLEPTAEGEAWAGFAASPTADEAAIIAGNDSRTLLNGFIWDDRDQDGDADGVQDVVELVMNQIEMLLVVPIPDFSASPTAGVTDLAVDFTDESDANVTSWSWDFGDGGTATTQNPSHSYTEAGRYTVSLRAGNANGSDMEIKEDYIAVGFTDTPPDFWAFEEVLDCVEAGIVGGYPEGNYQPDNQVDRAQMAVYVARMLAGGDAGVPPGPGTPSFTDVDAGHWAYDYVEYAVLQDVVQGFPEGDYKPDQKVTRAQMAVYVSRAAAGGDAGVPAGPGTATFDDVPTDHWAFKYVEYCVDNSIVQGYDPVTYMPDVIVTRGQMAVYTSRTLPLL